MTETRGPDGTSMAEAVRRGTTTAEELVTDALARIDAWDDTVNAFTVVLRDEAVARAREIDAADRSELGPLAGVPVSVKDHIWMADQPATNGSRALRDFVPRVDAVPVTRLREAGAVIVGKTNNPEFCYRGYTDNAVSGLTRNPWSPDRTPGGSSGGAGASVAYGATPLALGTDGGGSIRIPSAFCGVVGHKPSFGLIPKLPGFRGWPTLSVDGPLGASVRDLALAVRVLAGAHPADPLSWPVPLDDSGLDRSGLRVAVSEDLGWAPVDPEVRAAFRAAVDRLSDDGARIVQAHPDAGDPARLWNDIALPEGFASEGSLLDGERGDEIDPVTREIIESGRSATAADYLDAQERRVAFTETWETFFRAGEGEYDVLLAPSMPVPAFSTEVTGPAEIDGTPVDPFFDDWCVLALPANLSGQPATAVPTGLSSDGLPVGLQVIGPRWSDLRTLGVAARLEALLGFELLPATVGGPSL